MSEPLLLFYSYNYEDEPFRKTLDQHLKVLQRNGVIRTWSGRNISAGTEWKDQIDENLDRADLILLLVSRHFVASDYCYDIEMKRALERHERGEARVIPIMLSPVDWARTPFQKLQALPRNGEPVVKWPIQDEAWTDVAKSIRRIAEEIKTAEKGKPPGPARTPTTDAPTPTFISYAPEDASLFNELIDHLMPLVITGRIRLWRRREILAGQSWKDLSVEQIDLARMIVLLMSANFFASEQCVEEMTRALDRRAQDGTLVIPVIARSVAWENSPLGNLNALPASPSGPTKVSAKPVTSWHNRDEAWKEVTHGITDAIDNMDAGRSCSGRMQIIINMQFADFNDVHREWLRFGLAKFLNVAPDVVQIVSVEAGSVRLLIDAPPEGALRIAAAFARQDPALIEAARLPLRSVRVMTPHEPSLVSYLIRMIGESLLPLAPVLRVWSVCDGFLFDAGAAGTCTLSFLAPAAPTSPSEVLVWLSMADPGSPLSSTVAKRLTDDEGLVVWGTETRRFVQPRGALDDADDRQLDTLLSAARNVAAGVADEPTDAAAGWSWRDAMADILHQSANDRHHPDTIKSLASLLDVVPLRSTPRALTKLPAGARDLACEDLALAYLANRIRAEGFSPLSQSLYRRYARFDELREQALPPIEMAVRNLPFRGEAAALGLGAIGRPRWSRSWSRLLRRFAIGEHWRLVEVEDVLVSLQSGVAAHLKVLTGTLDEAAARSVESTAIHRLPPDPSLRAECARLIRELP